MNNSYIKHFFYCLVFVLMFSSCLVEPKYPIEPKIGNKSFKLINDTKDSLAVTFSFRDGDGDLGLNQAGTFNSPGAEDPKFDPEVIVNGDTIDNPLFFNIFLTILYQDINGEFVPVTIPDGLTLDGRFPRLTDEEKAKPIEGEMTYYKELTPGLARLISNKIIKMKVSIRDRSLHLSNEVETDTLNIPDL
jgi:hypothetical protein